jgi:hypothetical protein
MPVPIHLTALIQAHKSINLFNYSLAVNWAIEQLQVGNETPNILMLASFGPPIDRFEIKPYIAAALGDLGLQEVEGEKAVKAVIRYYATEILLNHAVRTNLRALFELALQYNEGFGFNLLPFYLLYYAWEDLDHMGYNYYYDGTTLENIESILKEEAYNWLEKN